MLKVHKIIFVPLNICAGLYLLCFPVFLLLTGSVISTVYMMLFTISLFFLFFDSLVDVTYRWEFEAPNRLILLPVKATCVVMGKSLILLLFPSSYIPLIFYTCVSGLFFPLLYYLLTYGLLFLNMLLRSYRCYWDLQNYMYKGFRQKFFSKLLKILDYIFLLLSLFILIFFSFEFLQLASQEAKPLKNSLASFTSVLLLGVTTIILLNKFIFPKILQVRAKHILANIKR